MEEDLETASLTIMLLLTLVTMDIEFQDLKQELAKQMVVGMEFNLNA